MMHGASAIATAPSGEQKYLQDLRSTLAWLKARGAMIETDKEINPDLEVTGLQKLMDGGCPVLFNNVKGKPNHKVLTNLFGDITVVNALFGWAGDKERTLTLARALSKPLPPREISQSEAPCQQIVIEGPNDVNEHLVPPLTFCFGVPPVCTLLAGAAFDYVILPYGCDELGVAGSAQGFPVRVVKARTVDAWAIADSEIVIEGYVDPRDRRFETAESEADQTQGKHHFHPEWAGYMGKAYKAPTFHVTGITMRKDAKRIIYCLGAHTLDEHNIDTSIREAAMFELCHRLQPGIIQDVNIPYCMTDWGGVIIQVKKRNRLEEGWQRNFLATLLATSQGMRLAIAVSEDTDIYSMDEIMWALTTRVNPQTDILNPTPGGRGQTFMPAERMTAGDREWTATNTRHEGGMGIDATVPYGYEEDFMRPVYPVDRVKLEDFFSKDDIANVTGRLKGWTELLAKSGR